MNVHEEFLSTIVGNSILIIMGIAVIFGNSKDIGYAALVDIFILLGFVLYSYIKHPEHFHRNH